MKGELGCVQEARMPGAVASTMNEESMTEPEDQLIEERWKKRKDTQWNQGRGGQQSYTGRMA